MKREIQVRYGARYHRVDPPVDPPAPPAPPAPPQPDDAAAQAKYAADLAKAEADKLKKQLAEMQAQMPSDEQRARWAQMEADHLKAEEERMKKAGEFDNWRNQINDRHTKELAAEQQNTANARALADAIERELNEKLIGLEFAAATEWFGPNGKTVLLPEVAQSYFAKNVSVDVQRDHDGTVVARSVIVKNNHGTVIVDPKHGKPAAFSFAIGELINAHPQKQQMLRGSGKVGSGSAGGGNGSDSIDLGRLRQQDFNDPAVREAVRRQQSAAGGLQIGPGFDRMRKPTPKS